MASQGGAGPTPGGSQTSIGITSAKLIRSGFGCLFRVSVTVAGSTTGSLYDSTSVSSLINEFGIIPMAIGVYEFLWPVRTGLVVVPGSGQTLSVSFE